MNYIFIDDILENYQIDLEVLRPNSNLYSTSLLQHKGIFHHRDSFFGNLNDETLKFNRFLNLARLNNSSLVATPEYSCPWNSIKHILDNNEFHPNTNKLWALGCESATPEEIKAFKEHYNELENIEVIYSDRIEGAASGILLNPCCYIFKAKNALGVEKTIVLIQFKTQHMGVWGSPLEQQLMIPGQNLYVLRNSPDSINLITVICSDAMVFDGLRIYNSSPGFWNNFPFIVLSIQMNPKPDHLQFTTFRNNILGKVNKDVITLNWSSNGKSSFNDDYFDVYSKSNISLVTDHIQNINHLEEKQVKLNHRKGVYYTLMKPNRHCFYFSPEIEYFFLRLRKPLAGSAPNEVVKRSGPEVDYIYNFDNVLEEFLEEDNIGDGFQEFIDLCQITSASLHDSTINVLDKERLISLTTGDIKIKTENQNWQFINTIQSFLLDDMETINRYTVTFDARGNILRRNQLEKLEELNINILTTPTLFPDIIASFKHKSPKNMFLNDNGYRYNYNLLSNDNEYATVVHLGSATSGEAKNMLKQLLDLFSKEDRENKRIVVWYKPNIKSYAFEATEVPKINNTDQANTTSITKL